MLRLRHICGTVMVAAGLIAGAPAASAAPDMHTFAIQLATDEYADPGLATPLVMGGSGFPAPPQAFADTAGLLYLQPLGFTGIPEVLPTPEWTHLTDISEAVGSFTLTGAIVDQILKGEVDADDPLAVFGYSQSAALSTFTMQQLQALGVPSDFVHFVLVGDSAAPNGGILSAFNPFPGWNLPIPNLGITLGNPTPDDLYPTDVYTLEYDGYADFPHYPTNSLSVLNALMGMLTQHLVYLGLSPEQIADAIPLETAGDSLVNYHMIPSETLPLLLPLQFTPIIGKPLYDLLEPATRILVNLGYGSIDEGWNQGAANVATPVSLLPPDLNWSDVFSALNNGMQQGISDFTADLQDPSTYEITAFVENPVLSTLWESAYGAGYIDDANPSSLLDLLGSVIIDPAAGTSLSDVFGDLFGDLGGLI